MKLFVPHAAIVLAILGLVSGALGEGIWLVLFAAGHLAVPIWAATVADRSTTARAILLGPALVIGVHVLIMLVAWLILIGGHPEGTWISLMLVMIWAVVVAIYTVYCTIAFSLVARARRSRGS